MLQGKGTYDSKERQRDTIIFFPFADFPSFVLCGVMNAYCSTEREKMIEYSLIFSFKREYSLFFLGKI